VLARLLQSTTRGARIATLVAVGMVLGVVLAAAALTGNPTRFVTVADGASSATTPTGAAHGKSGEHSKAAKADKADKTAGQGESEAPDSEDATGSGGVHGSCVAAVAQDHSKVGGPHHNHGWVVSRAAHTCPNPRPSGSASD
jgi:uncharacterized low-complexity protein